MFLWNEYAGVYTMHNTFFVLGEGVGLLGKIWKMRYKKEKIKKDMNKGKNALNMGWNICIFLAIMFAGEEKISKRRGKCTIYTPVNILILLMLLPLIIARLGFLRPRILSCFRPINRSVASNEATDGLSWLRLNIRKSSSLHKTE